MQNNYPKYQIKPMRVFQYPEFLIIVAALLITVVVGVVVATIEDTFLTHNPYFFDSATYLFTNAQLSVLLGQRGQIPVAMQEWLTNDRDPLRTIPLILFAPSLLAQPLGHLATALPMLGIFLALLGWTIYRRTGHVAYAVVCMALFGAIPGIYHPQIGLGAYWLDLPAAFLVAGAALCLFNSDGAKRLRWLVGFALLASAAALSRYVAAVYVFVLCAPLLLIYLLYRWKNEHSFRSVLVSLISIGGIIGITVGYYLTAHLQANINSYSAVGYALGKGIGLALFSTIKQIGSFLGIPFAAGLVLVFVYNLFLLTKSSAWKTQLPLGWLAAAHILYLGFIIRVVGHAQAPFYAIPMLFLLAVSPVPWDRAKANSRLTSGIVFCLLVLALGSGSMAAIRSYLSARSPSPEMRDQKAVDVELAAILADEKRPLVWSAYYDEYVIIPTLEAFYRDGILLSPSFDPDFTIHESYWNAFYPGKTPDRVCELVYDQTTQRIDVAVVFDDPGSANTRFDNPYSRLVAYYVADRIKNDSEWEKWGTLNSIRYGELAVYYNRARKGATDSR